MNTVYGNADFALVCTEAGGHRFYTVHHRLGFNEIDETPIAEAGNTPREAAALADAELARLAMKARIQANTAAYLAGTSGEVEMTVNPPQGWDSAEA